jgi:hypothetical protein
MNSFCCKISCSDCADNKKSKLTLISNNATLVQVHQEHFGGNSVRNIEIFLRNGDDWLVATPELWNAPLGSILGDFPITQIRYSCSEPPPVVHDEDNVKPAQRSAFAVLMRQMSTKTALPDKRTKRSV